jgi:hypothetical protein
MKVEVAIMLDANHVATDQSSEKLSAENVEKLPL